MIRHDANMKIFPGLAVLAVVGAAGLFAIIRDRPCLRSAGLGGPSLQACETPANNSGPSTDGNASRQVTEKAARQSVEKLVSEQKFEAAAAECARIREEARKSGDTSLWTWALIRESQLR